MGHYEYELDRISGHLHAGRVEKARFFIKRLFSLSDKEAKMVVDIYHEGDDLLAVIDGVIGGRYGSVFTN